MKITFLFAIWLILAIDALACDAPSYLTVGSSAQIKINALLQAQPPDTLTLAILLHNQAFYSKKKETKQHAQLLFSRCPQTPVVRSYRLSLQLMDIRDSGKFKKIFGTMTGSLIKKARNQIRTMSAIVAQNPGNDTLLLLHCSSIIEAAEYLPEFMPDAQDELNILRQTTIHSDSVKYFFIELIEAKYFYKRAATTGESEHLTSARKHLDLAGQLACDEYHFDQIRWWEKRIKK